ncbi:hypothetical protein CPB83DRAFT_801500 [Crepidotus variabilis]|uniref:Carbohydrate esterase family 16 protein n=1 Tax=Crepidotus variabilis TaxID=179855 RepID=A0A9P6JWN2_9AGAR|nr:hypothetical protein CPB83DRAFT_801500 [Crepidotus variabilis]
MSKIIQLGPSWKGFPVIRKLVVFGDSYSSVEDLYSSTVPDARAPLGVPFPGFTWNEVGHPNWIGHLITKYCPKPRYVPPETAEDVDDQPELQEMIKDWQDSPLLVYDYAKGGESVFGVKRQIEQLFKQGMGTQPNWAKWTPEETLFVIWVGTNDCCGILPDNLKGIFGQYFTTLHSAGAKNFLIIDVPAVHRIPGGRQSMMSSKNSFGRLIYRILDFVSSHNDVTALLFSSLTAFNLILDDLASHGMNADDERKQGGSVWMDHIHPTSQFHERIAQKVAEYLDGVPPFILM